uniref:AAA+ ATPase domain-containing protein n=1 Tax=Araucaria cunninghamii TaxID=56994 RepID=A0A0D6QZ73_ARACU
MDFISGPVNEIIKSLYDPLVQQIKALISLPDDAKNLKGKIDRVESIVLHINDQLQQHGRNPLSLVKDWLHREDELIQFATGALKIYEEIQKRRCCCCCYWCSLGSAISVSNSIRKSLTDIDELLQRKESDFPADGELGEIRKALVQPVDSELVGAFIHEKLSELETWLIKDDNVRVIGVYGMPGVGKTTVLKEINNNEKVTSFFKFVIWVTVSRDFDITALQSRMCERLELTLPTNCSIDEGAAFLHTVLKAKSLLLILDDVWTPFDVAKLGVTPNQSGDAIVKILLSTRSKSLCDKMKADKTIAMKELTEDEGWELFSKGVFGRRNVPVMDSKVEELVRSIAKECKGHPLALKTVAQTVPKKLEAKELEFILNQLKAVNLNFFRTHEELITDLFKPLKYSYDALPTVELKICFLYLAAFREDVEIDAQELIEIWRAEGLINDYGQGRYVVLKTLDDRCLAEIETKEEKGVEICKVKIHDVLRDMAVQIGENDENSIFRVGNSLKSFPNCASTQLRVSVMHNQIRSLPEEFDCSELLSLFLGWNRSLAEVPKRFLDKLSLLKALDLSSTAIKSLPLSIGQLKNLVYLRLSNSQIEVLPKEVCLLTSLQLLDLSFSSLTDLPSGISELKRLRILYLTQCKRLKFVSSRISELTCLEELDMWEASFAFSGQANGAETENRMSSSREASLQDVCCLHGLKRLQVSIKSPIVHGLMGSLGEVRDLGLLWGVGVHQADLPSDMKELGQLERLHLRNCDMSGTPDLFSTYENLKYLKLNCCRRLQTLGGLGLRKLPNLRELEIQECRELNELGGEFGGKGNFPRLSIVKLRKLPSLDGLFGDRVEAGALCSLQSLGIFRCKNLKRLPSGLDSLKSPMEIRGSAEWWNGIEWEEEEMKNRLQSKYVEVIDN